MPHDAPDLAEVAALAGKTFVVCIGAMKCGTSWLHTYLGGVPDMAASPLKELHFFNAKFTAHAFGDMELLAMKRLGLHLNRKGNPVETLLLSEDFRASLDRVQMIYDDAAYFDHFARMNTPDTRAFCDITPAYSVLGLNGFAYLRGFFATQPALRLKLVYILRDPIDRLWSQLRHLQEINPDGKIAERWEKALETPAIMARADYAGTMDDLDLTFAPEDVHHVFYEDLFSEPALRDLCAFAGVTYVPADAATRQNRTRLELELPEAARTRFREVLAGQYEACRARFGDRVPEAWSA